VRWTIPADYGAAWSLVLDTRRSEPQHEAKDVARRITTSARSIAVLQTTPSPE
jgi:hypothetical protein